MIFIQVTSRIFFNEKRLRPVDRQERFVSDEIQFEKKRKRQKVIVLSNLHLLVLYATLVLVFFVVQSDL